MAGRQVRENEMNEADAGAGRDGGPEPTLLALSRELAGARDMALDLQEATAALVARATADAGLVDGLPPDTLFRLQGLDRLTQTLDDLSGFLADLARTAPPLDATSAVRCLRLQDLVASLGSASLGAASLGAARLGHGKGARPRPAAGDLDDFLF